MLSLKKFSDSTTLRFFFTLLVSGLSGRKEIAQSKVSVGMGMLAGSTILLLTTVWGSCIVVGKREIQGSIARHSKDTKRFSWTGTLLNVINHMLQVSFYKDIEYKTLSNYIMGIWKN